MLPRLALLLALVSTAAAATVATKCFSGFIMDTLCINLGTLIDHPNLRSLSNPGVHSVGCMLDIPGCVSGGYEILTGTPKKGKDYTRAVKFNAAGNKLIVAYLKANGVCASGCKGKITNGINATVKGTIINSKTVPPTMNITKVYTTSTKC